MAVLIPTSVFAQQFLPVKGIVNARDLGGYAMEDGRIVQSGRLLRAAHLADATDEDIRNLERLPVTAVIDFRKEQEKVGKVDREVPGARYTSLPVDPSGNAMATATEEEKKKFSGQKKFDVRKVIVFACFSIRTANSSSPAFSGWSWKPITVPSSSTAPRGKTVPASHRPCCWLHWAPIGKPSWPISTRPTGSMRKTCENTRVA